MELGILAAMLWAAFVTHMVDKTDCIKQVESAKAAQVQTVNQEKALCESNK